MEKKPSHRILVILLGLSWVVYAVAVPSARSSMIWKNDPSVQNHIAKEDMVMEIRSSDEVLEMKEEVEERRMMMNTADYSGTKPNPSHNPKSPGKRY